MKEFAELVQVLGTSTKTNDKLDALSQYFLSASDKDKVWVIAIVQWQKTKENCKWFFACTVVLRNFQFTFLAF